MTQDDMDGRYLGGGLIDHVISGGDVYLKAEHLAFLFNTTGYNMMVDSIMTGNQSRAVTANALMSVGEKFFDLRSELLKQEAEKLFEAE